jgi:hypothetical protein
VSYPRKRPFDAGTVQNYRIFSHNKPPIISKMPVFMLRYASRGSLATIIWNACNKKSLPAQKAKRLFEDNKRVLYASPLLTSRG